MPRLFIAIDLPADIKEAIKPLCCGLPGARWVPDDQLHLTLRFIGDLDHELFAELYAGLEEVKAKPFPLHIKGLGTFPPRGKPRVLWLGLKKSDALIDLRKKVDSVLRRLEIPLEKKKFAPHITIARLGKTPAPRLGTYLAANNLFRQPPFRVTSFHLYSSILKPEGAVHTCEAEYFL
ncbi:MAG: RNA 2',3'-cyclic phosphodiesterase [Desulfobulbaceae bacterium]|nr:MAG: RNA 2',3'-cyclic phosphodiesterase [Desulfobulbaceae bacterium]